MKFCFQYDIYIYLDAKSMICDDPPNQKQLGRSGIIKYRTWIALSFHSSLAGAVVCHTLILGSADPCGLDMVAAATRRGWTTSPRLRFLNNNIILIFISLRASCCDYSNGILTSWVLDFVVSELTARGWRTALGPSVNDLKYWFSSSLLCEDVGSILS